QLILAYERFQLRAHYDVLKVVDVFHHAPDLGHLPSQRAKIGAHAVAELACFADVDDLVGPVAHYVNPRFEGQGFYSLVEAGSALGGSYQGSVRHSFGRGVLLSSILSELPRVWQFAQRV